MRILKELSSHAPKSVLLSMVLGLIAGLCYVALIPLVLSSLKAFPGFEYQQETEVYFLGIEIANYKLASVFFLLCFAILLFRSASQILLSSVTVSLTKKLREDFYKKINTSPTDKLEGIGPSKLINILLLDINRIVDGAATVPQVVVNAVTVFGMIIYIWFVNPDVFIFIICALVFGIFTYQIPVLISRQFFKDSRGLMDVLQESFRGLVYGSKDLKLNKVKSENFIDNDLVKTEKNLMSRNLKGNAILTVGINYGDIVSLLSIGALAFAFVNYENIATDELVSTIMVMLYIAGPIGGILVTIPLLMEAGISSQKMRSILAELSMLDGKQVFGPMREWSQISLSQVTYSYGKSDGFKLGPIDLSIRKGEITFIVGGNGSGKSTLSKLITQHYIPESGTISFDDVAICDGNINAYRQSISSVYSDYYLFSTIHSVSNQNNEFQQLVEELLHELDLEEKVKFENGEFSTIKLSDGQKRRLALLVAMIEDKELYLFDEWAADQDPQFREVYYRKILPELKQKNKAIVVISHDDRYFDMADNLIKLESGIRLRL